MKIVFMGTPDFAVDCLETLCRSEHEVCAVFTQPDKPRGRKMILTPPEVKAKALEYGLRVYQPESLKNSDAFDTLKALDPDIIVVVAYGKIIPKNILDLPEFGCINVHASLLPRLRGAAPIQRSIIGGDEVTGISIMQLDEGLDTGDILMTKATAIGENETAGELFDRLKVLGAGMLLEALKGIQDHSLTPQKQNDAEATYAHMLSKDEATVGWTMPARQVHDLVRGMDPWPVARTVFEGKTIKLFGSGLSSLKGDKPGEVMSLENGLTVCCGDGGCVNFGYLQLEGKKKLAAQDFLRGSHVTEGSVLG